MPTYFPGQGGPQAPQPQRAGSYFPGSTDPPPTDAGPVPSADTLPEVWQANLEGQGMLPGLRFLAAQAFNSDPADLEKSLSGIPGVAIAHDKSGQPVATVGGKPYALNRKGLSPQDFGPMLASGVPLTALTGGAAGALGIGGTLMGEAAAGAGAGALETAGQQATGADRSASDYLGAAGIGGAAGVLGQLGARALGRWLGASKAGILDPTGALTATGTTALRDARIDPGSLTPDTLRAVDQALRGARQSPMDVAASVRQAQAQRFGIDLTAGQATRDPQRLAAEAMLAKGGQGVPASELMQGRTAAQLGALQPAAENLAQRIAPNAVLGSAMGETGTGAAAIQGLQDADQAAGQRVNDAYDAFRQAAKAGGFVLPATAGDRLAQAIPAAFQARDLIVSPETAPKAMAAVRTLMERTQGQPVTPEMADVLRRAITNLERSATDRTDRAALGTVRDAYDGWLRAEMSALPNAGASGTLDLLDQARALARQRFSTFGPAGPRSAPGLDTVAKAVQGRIEPSPLIDKLFGGGNEIDASAMPVATRVRDALGANSDAWQQVQRALVRRVVLGSEDQQAMGLEAGRNGMDLIHGRLQRALEGKGGELLRDLLGHSGHAQLSELRDVLASMRPAPDFMTGPSGAATTRAVGESGAKLAGTLMGTAAGAGVGALGHMVGAPWLAGATAPIGGMVGRELGPMVRDRAGRLAAQRALAGYAPPPAMGGQIAGLLPPALTAAGVAPPWYPPQGSR